MFMKMHNSPFFLFVKHSEWVRSHFCWRVQAEIQYRIQLWVIKLMHYLDIVSIDPLWCEYMHFCETAQLIPLPLISLNSASFSQYIHHVPLILLMTAFFGCKGAESNSECKKKGQNETRVIVRETWKKMFMNFYLLPSPFY